MTPDIIKNRYFWPAWGTWRANEGLPWPKTWHQKVTKFRLKSPEDTSSICFRPLNSAIKLDLKSVSLQSPIMWSHHATICSYHHVIWSYHNIMVISQYDMYISPHHMAIPQYHMDISPYHMAISPYHMVISLYMIISRYHMVISPYHMVISQSYHHII